MKDFLFLFLFFLILIFEQFQIGLFLELIFVHFFNVLSGSDKVIFFRVNEFFLCRNLIFHVVIFVLDKFSFWNWKTEFHVDFICNEGMHVNLAPWDAELWVDSQAALNEVSGISTGLDFRIVFNIPDWNFLTDIFIIFSLKRVFTVKHLVKDDSNRPYVCKHSVGLSVQNLRSHCKTSPKLGLCLVKILKLLCKSQVRNFNDFIVKK